MVNPVREFPARPVRFRADETASIHGALAEVLRSEGMRPELRAEVEGFQAWLDAKTASHGKWRFIMTGLEEFDWLVNEIDRSPDFPRPMLAMRLLSVCAMHIRRDSGEVLLDRSAIAAKLGVSADEISRVAGKLVKLGVLRRERGRGSLVRYFLNERLATHQTGGARDDAQDSASPLGGVVDLGERRSERRRHHEDAPRPVL